VISIEKILVLAITYPDYSKRKKYYTLCIAGINEDFELFRIFPIPLHYYIKNTDILKKYNWINCKLLESGDYRNESYKVDCRSICSQNLKNFNLFSKVNENYCTLEDLENIKADNFSLGFIKPIITGISLSSTKARMKKKRFLSNQLTLFSGNLGENYIPYLIRFEFRCESSDNCTGHNIICEDIFFWKIIKKSLDNGYPLNEIEENLKTNYLNSLIGRKDIIFFVGTHVKYKTWLIISIIYPDYFLS